MSIRLLPYKFFPKQLNLNNVSEQVVFRNLLAGSYRPCFIHILRFAHANHSDLNGGNLKYTVGEILKKWNREFINEKISEPAKSAEYIMAYVLNTKRVSDVYRQANRLLQRDEITKVNNLCKKRLDRMPVQYIIQEWDFRDLTLKMSRPVFIPRPETEILVDIVLNEIDRKEVDSILEFCCGSGAISLALLKARPKLHILAVDKSKQACDLIRENANINKLSERIEIIRSEVAEDFSLDSIEKFDVIVSNPPYIPSKEMINLQPEIRLYEDPGALDGGEDGLSVIKSILKVCSCLLNYHGKLFLEVDPSHPTLIKSWLQKNDSLGLKFSGLYKDFCGAERFVEIIKEK